MGRLTQEAEAGGATVDYIIEGAVAGAIASSAVAATTGVGGISVTAAGVSTTVTTGTSFGKLGTLIVNNGDQIIDWSNTTAHGLRRMVERGVTKDMADLWVRSGKALQQSSGQIIYITRQGAVVVNKLGQVITAYGKEYFDANMQEVVKKLFGK